MEKIDTVCRGEALRIDVFTAKTAEITRSRAAGLIADGNVLINGKAAAKNAKVKDGDSVTITLPDPETYDITPEDIPLDIVYEDGDLLDGKRVLIVDDVVSTGGSLKAVKELLVKFNANVVASCFPLAEGDAADRDDIIYLEKLPLFFK